MVQLKNQYSDVVEDWTESWDIWVWDVASRMRWPAKQSCIEGSYGRGRQCEWDGRKGMGL